MSWRKISGIAKHLDMSPRATRDLIKAEVIPVTRLPSGTILGNLDLIDKTLLKIGDEKAKKQKVIIDKCLEGLK